MDLVVSIVSKKGYLALYLTSICFSERLFFFSISQEPEYLAKESTRSNILKESELLFMYLLE